MNPREPIDSGSGSNSPAGEKTRQVLLVRRSSVRHREAVVYRTPASLIAAGEIDLQVVKWMFRIRR
jgi:hypothetical protein